MRILVERAPIVRRILQSGAAAGADWHWSRQATESVEKAERAADSIWKLFEVEPGESLKLEASTDLRAAGFTRELRPFQENSVARIVHAGRGADFSVPGSGKTTVAYAAWTAMKLLGKIQGLIVVAPPSAFEAWEEEASACFDPVSRPTVRIRPRRLSNTDDVVVLNYERLSDASVVAALRAWVRNRRVLVVFDEAHRAKAGSASRRGMAASELARLADASLVLTGTPMPNRESDLAAILDLVWQGYGPRLVGGDLAERRDHVFVRVTKEDLGIPRMDLRTERVVLEPSHRQIYDAMSAAVKSWSTRAEITAAEAGKALMRLLAAATNPGAVFDPGASWSLSENVQSDTELAELLRRPIVHVRSAKIVRAAQIVAENRRIGRKTLVWSIFVDNVRLLAEALVMYNPAVVIGETAISDSTQSTDRLREVARFRNNKDCWVLIATPQTLGEGISLHRTCTDQIHVDRGYSAGTWLQSIDRTHRLGLPADARVTCTVLEADETIDGRVSEVLNAKVVAMASALSDRSLKPVADPAIVPDDPVASVLGDIDALREIFRVS